MSYPSQVSITIIMSFSVMFGSSYLKKAGGEQNVSAKWLG